MDAQRARKAAKTSRVNKTHDFHLNLFPPSTTTTIPHEVSMLSLPSTSSINHINSLLFPHQHQSTLRELLGLISRIFIPILYSLTTSSLVTFAFPLRLSPHTLHLSAQPPSRAYSFICRRTLLASSLTSTSRLTSQPDNKQQSHQHGSILDRRAVSLYHPAPSICLVTEYIRRQNIALLDKYG